MAGRAFAQAWRQAGGNGQRAPFTYSAAAGRPRTDSPRISFSRREFNLRQWINDLGINSVGPCERVKAGACSAQVALRRAANILESGVARCCAFCVADTQLHIRVSRWHEDHFRLKCAYLTDGLMPVRSSLFPNHRERFDARPVAHRFSRGLVPTGISTGGSNDLSERPNTAKVLTAASRSALGDARLEASEIGAVWSDLNGESYRAREWAFSEIRLGFKAHTELIHPADCYGDVGAASDAILFGLAALAQATGWSGGKPALVFTGSEAGIRGATIIAPAAADFIAGSSARHREAPSGAHLGNLVS